MTSNPVSEERPNGHPQECPTYASGSRGSRPKSSRPTRDFELGCSRVGKVSPRTAAKWACRYQAEGSDRLKSTAPPDPIAVHAQLRLPWWIESSSCVVSATPGYHIAQRILGLSAGHHQPHPPARPSEPLAPPVSPPPVIRYEHPQPGDLLHLDIKGLTRYQQVSLRADGRRRGLPQTPAPSPCTSPSMTTPAWALPNFCPIRQPRPTRAFLHDALAFYGVSCTASRFAPCSPTMAPAIAPATSAKPCTQLDIRHRFTRPYTPRTNGKAERFIQTALREWAYA